MPIPAPRGPRTTRPAAGWRPAACAAAFALLMNCSATAVSAQTGRQNAASSSTASASVQRPVPAASSPPRADPPAASRGVEPSQDVDRVRAALSRKPTMNLDADRLRFYVEIATKRPTFSEFAKDYDFVNGAAKGGDPMSHQEFLDLVTPKELRHTGGLVLSW